MGHVMWPDLTTLLVPDFSQTLLACIPGGDIFDVCVTEVGGKSTHDGILTLPASESMQALTQVVLVLPAKVGVNRLDGNTRRAMAGITDG